MSHVIAYAFGVVMGIVISSTYPGSESQKGLKSCAKEHNVYSCHLEFVPDNKAVEP